MLSLTSWTLNVAEIFAYLSEALISNRPVLVGQILVSRIGNVGWTKRQNKVPNRNSLIPQRVWINNDKRDVAMEVGII